MVVVKGFDVIETPTIHVRAMTYRYRRSAESTQLKMPLSYVGDATPRVHVPVHA